MYVIPRYRRKFTEIMLNDYRSDKENIAKRVSTLSDLEESSDISTAESFLEFCKKSDSEKFLSDLKSLVYSQYHVDCIEKSVHFLETTHGDGKLLKALLFYTFLCPRKLKISEIKDAIRDEGFYCKSYQKEIEKAIDCVSTCIIGIPRTFDPEEAWSVYQSAKANISNID